MENTTKYRVLGLTVMKYIGEGCYGHNCDFEYEPEEMEKIYVHIERENHGCRRTILLDNSYGECGSGWTTASWGVMEVVNRLDRLPLTHVPKDKNLMIDLPEIIDKLADEDEIHNEVFEFSADGGDGYYPMGGSSVNLELFEAIPRAMEKRPVYIFKGASGLGKSTLALGLYTSKLNYSVYETDKESCLPEIITNDIVVIGNKYQFAVEDVTKKLFGDVEVIVVDFERG